MDIATDFLAQKIMTFIFWSGIFQITYWALLDPVTIT